MFVLKKDTFVTKKVLINIKLTSFLLILLFFISFLIYYLLSLHRIKASDFKLTRHFCVLKTNKKH